MTQMPARTIRVLIVDGDATIHSTLQHMLRAEGDIDVVGGTFTGQDAVQKVEALNPDVVLMAAELPDTDGISVTEALVAQHPTCGVILLANHFDAEALRRAMVAGARDFLVKPLAAEELVRAIRKVYEIEAAIRARLAPVLPGQPAASSEPRLGKIIAVYSPKGGAGRTTIATNLAVALHRHVGAKVALVDGSLLFGDIAIVLNIPPKKTIIDLVSVTDHLDADVIESTMARHQSGIHVLLAPVRPEMAELVAPHHLKQILTLMRTMYDYIVVDTWPSFQELVLSILDMAERIVVVSTLEMHSVKNLRLFLEVADALHYPPEKLVLVLNRADSSGGMRIQDVEANVNRKFSAEIVNDWRVATLAINEGTPFVMSHPQSQIAQDIIALAGLIAGKEPAQNGRVPVAQVDKKNKAVGWLGKVFK
jgi:pilus assembly protein CpaE